MLPKDDREKIERELGLLQNDKRQAEFYMHKVIDVEATQAAAIEVITRKAQEKTIERQAYWTRELERAEKFGLPTENIKEQLVNSEIIPDYSPDNLKKHGAKQVYKNVVYVKIKKVGSKDYRSYPATDEHKQQFPKAWAKFESENENIYKERDSVRTETSGRENDTQSGNWQSGGVSYTPPAYTISFG